MIGVTSESRPVTSTGFARLFAVRPRDPNVLQSTTGYLVADARGRVVGRVEQAGSGEGDPRLTVRGGFPLRRRRIVPVSAIDEIDTTTRVIALSVEREALRAA
jgi:hypothetical protein